MGKLSRRTFLVGTAGLLAASTGISGKEGRRSMRAKFDPDQFIADMKRASCETESQGAVEEVLARALERFPLQASA